MTLLDESPIAAPPIPETGSTGDLPPLPPLEPPGPGRRWWRSPVAWIAAVAVVVSLAALAVASSASFDVRQYLPPAMLSGGGAGPAAAGAGAPMSVDVELGDLFVKPASLEVTAGTDLTLNVMNHGAAQHNLQIGGGATGTGMIDPGGVTTLHVGVVNAATQLWCTVAGHKAAGMSMAIAIKGAPSAAVGSAASAPAPSHNAVIDFNATPANGWHAVDPALQPAAAATVHRVTFEASEVVKEVAPGVTQEVWAFNGQVPGPILRGHVGDTFEVTLVNKGKMGHSIDFHASKTPMDVDMRTLKPGESLVYRFTATASGIFMYHCGTAPALHHIGNGMFGAVVIDPPGLPAVDREFVFVQSEIYTGPMGQAGDLDKMKAVAPDAVVFNGYVSQYKFAPIGISAGQRVRAWVLDAGPSENSSFHIVGTIFDTVYKEGAYTLRRDATNGGAQSLDLQPAQGGFVEFTLDKAGMYAMVTHKFANVGKGALGVFHVT